MQHAALSDLTAGTSSVGSRICDTLFNSN